MGLSPSSISFFACLICCGVNFGFRPIFTPPHSPQRALLDELFEQTHELAERCADFSADRGLDCAETKVKLWDEHHIRPLIDTRELWRLEKQEPNYEPGQLITRPSDNYYGLST